MSAIVWTDSMLDMLRAEFPTSLNKKLSCKIGVSVRTMIRKARELGLEKVETFMTDNQKEIIDAIKFGQRVSHNTGWHKTQFQKGCNPNEYSFKPGHINNKELMGEERFRLMINKAVQTRLQTIKMERARAAFGLPQKTRLRVEKQSKRKIGQNYYLRKRGYILDVKNGIAYYTESTQRCKRIENKQQYFKFKCETEREEYNENMGGKR